MLKLKRILTCLVLIAALAVANLLPVMAESTEVLNVRHPYAISWNSAQGGAVLDKITIGKVDFTYTYNENQSRIIKASKDSTVIFGYDDESKLISEVRDNNRFEYQYDYLNSLTGFTLNNTVYKYVKDDDFNVIAITDENDNYIAKYEYDKNGIVSAILGKDEAGNWVDMSNDNSFIGSLNLIRLHSYYFDIETGWYYNGHKYYDSTKNNYIVNKDNLNIKSGSPKPKSGDAVVLGDPDLTPTQQRIVNWYNSLMNDPSFGTPISYTSGWYNSLSDVELLTRLLYGENTINEYDQDSVARVLINRKNANFGGGTYRGVATQSGQFEPITGGSGGTENARVPNTSNPRWSNAVFAACTLLTSSSTTDYDFFLYKPAGISNQLYFVGLNYFLSNFSNGNPISKDAVPAGSGLTYSFNSGSSYVKMKDVVIVFDNSTLQNPGSRSSITSNTKLDTFSERASHNIFFNY